MSFRFRWLALAEFILVIAIGLTGLLVSRPFFIITINSLSPWLGLLSWYIALTLWLFVLILLLRVIAHAPITISAGRIGSFQLGLTEIVASVLIAFGFFIVWNWAESAYATDILQTSPVANLFLMTEDGVAYLFWHQYPFQFGVATAGLLTYVITPMLLWLLAASLVGTKMFVNLWLRAGRP